MEDNTLETSSGAVPAKRKSRYEDSREATTREYSKKQRRSSFGFATSGFNIPQHVQDAFPDKKLVFCAYSRGGQLLEKNWDDAVQQRGMIPVKKNFHPYFEKKYADSPFERKDTNDFMKYGMQGMGMFDLEDFEEDEAFFHSLAVKEVELAKKYEKTGSADNDFISFQRIPIIL